MNQQFTHENKEGYWKEYKSRQRGRHAQNHLFQAFCPAKEDINPYYIYNHEGEGNRHSRCHQNNKGSKYDEKHQFPRHGFYLISPILRLDSKTTLSLFSFKFGGICLYQVVEVSIDLPNNLNQEKQSTHGNNERDYKFRSFQNGRGKVLGIKLILSHFESIESNDKKDESRNNRSKNTRDRLIPWA
jgi:hypothetical protein